MSRTLPDDIYRQIYHAYRSGPHALFRLFEQPFGQQALCAPPLPDSLQLIIDDLSAQIARLQAQLQKLKAERRELHYRTFQLQRRNRELESLSARDSHNSSRAPSADPPWARRTRSRRRPSGQRPGGQAGHRGSTLRLVVRPDSVIEHRPKECRHCHFALAEAEVVRHFRQQVWEVVPAQLKVIKRRMALLRCPSCGKRTDRYPHLLSAVNGKSWQNY